MVDATPGAGRKRARVLYPTPQPCEWPGCDRLGERHHIDGNTLNNYQSNIAWLCRGHHFRAEGRGRIIADSRRHRGTQSLGEAHHAAKLTAAKVMAARRRHVKGESMASLAREMGVTIQSMSKAIRGETWRHLA